MLAVCSTASAHIAFFWSGSMPKPSSSTREADSPVPQADQVLGGAGGSPDVIHVNERYFGLREMSHNDHGRAFSM